MPPRSIQKALLPQTDRATRYISSNLVNCCTTVETSCTANRQQVEVMELWVTADRLVVNKPLLVNCRIGVVNKLDRQRALLTMTTRSTCSGEIFKVQSLEQSFRVLSFLMVPEFP